MRTLPLFRTFIALCAVFRNCVLGAAEVPNFDKQIRPILSDKCYACHGPDEHKRKAGLRLDRKESAFRELKSGKHAVVPGKPEESSLLARINSTDPEEKMPPPDSNKKLSAEEISLLKLWIKPAAQPKEHWAYFAPERLC